MSTDADVGTVRRAVRAEMRDAPEGTTADAELVASELVTNDCSGPMWTGPDEPPDENGHGGDHEALAGLQEQCGA